MSLKRGDKINFIFYPTIVTNAGKGKFGLHLHWWLGSEEFWSTSPNCLHLTVSFLRVVFLYTENILGPCAQDCLCHKIVWLALIPFAFSYLQYMCDGDFWPINNSRLVITIPESAQELQFFANHHSAPWSSSHSSSQILLKYLQNYAAAGKCLFWN